MSTFGKKSLIWWNYKNAHVRDNVIRYNHTPLELQLQILNKWYPIGMLVEYNLYSSSKIYRITDHVKFNNLIDVYYLQIEIVDKEQLTKNGFMKEKEVKHPLQIKPLDSEITQLKRDIKINKLLL
jgi:hypothetical protein